MNRTDSELSIMNAESHLKDASSEGRRDDAIARRNAALFSKSLSESDAGGSAAKTDATSHEGKARREGGRLLKIPFMRREIVGCAPIENPPIGGIMDKRTER